MWDLDHTLAAIGGPFGEVSLLDKMKVLEYRLHLWQCWHGNWSKRWCIGRTIGDNPQDTSSPNGSRCKFRSRQLHHKVTRCFAIFVVAQSQRQCQDNSSAVRILLGRSASSSCRRVVAKYVIQTDCWKRVPLSVQLSESLVSGAVSESGSATGAVPCRVTTN